VPVDVVSFGHVRLARRAWTRKFSTVPNVYSSVSVPCCKLKLVEWAGNHGVNLLPLRKILVGHFPVSDVPAIYLVIYTAGIKSVWIEMAPSYRGFVRV
jgi:hypothetical protein